MRPRHGALPFLILALCLCMGLSPARADALAYETVPHVLRPGKYYDIVVTTPGACVADLTLIGAQGEAVHTILRDFPLTAGRNALTWDGLRPDQTAMTPGEYTLRLATSDGGQLDAALRVGAPYPMLTGIACDPAVVTDGGQAVLAFTASDAGTLRVDLTSYLTGQTSALDSVDIPAGANRYEWNGELGDTRVIPGEYALILTLETDNGNTSTSQHVFVTVDTSASAAPAIVVEITVPPPLEEAEATAAPQEAVEAPTPAAIGQTSAPYSSLDDGTFWSMTPGEVDDAVIWDILTQPITVYDDGKIKGNGHVYLMENPDGTGAKIAQIHGKSQALHILSDANEHGYVLAEAFSNYDPDYNPSTDEERAHAFDLKQGYILASGLKTVEVNQDIGLVIDKLTQRMYMYVDGVPVTEFLIATGKIADNKYYNETIPGEYITISHVGGFWSGNMYCDMAIRINGGILLHEVPYKENADGTKNYSSFEAYLGTKQSHGCVRIQRLKTPEGYNARWLWENLDRKGGYKVIIWDDLNRVDTPTTWQENP